jgi:hypothetical protein
MAARKRAQDTGWWSVLNSNIVILLVSSALLSGVAKLYSDHQDAEKEMVVRRGVYAKLLTEFEHRVSALSNEDISLDPYLGEGLNFRKTKMPDHGPERQRWDKAQLLIGQREVDIIQGRGSYVPSLPEYAGMNLQAIAVQLEDVGGVPDIQMGGIRLMGALDSGKEVVWLFVRSWLPIMRQVTASRHLMYSDGRIPFPRGHVVTASEERALGIPEFHPGDLERLEKENDAHFREVQAKLGAAAAK